MPRRKAPSAPSVPDTPPKAPPEPAASPLVRYYLDGWRFGYLESVKGETARIRPIAALHAAQPRTLRVPMSDVQRVQQ